MTPVTLPPSIAAIEASGRITPDDVLAIRRSVYPDGSICEAEAEWIFHLDGRATETCREWTDFFLESLTDYVVRQVEPEGYVSDENAAWLIARISRDGVVKSDTELELLVRILDKATAAPASLSAFALKQVSQAVIDGDGPLARGRLTPGVINRDEVELLRRILFAFASHSGMAISRDEAEVLFDLNDRTIESENDPAWSDLFVKAVANFLMAARGYAPPSREDALRREAWLDSRSGTSRFMGEIASSLLTSSLRSTWSLLTRSGGEVEAAFAERNRKVVEEERVASAITSDEIRWLADRIGRDGVVHENERALLRFLRDESPDLHPSLRTLLDTAA